MREQAFLELETGPAPAEVEVEEHWMMAMAGVEVRYWMGEAAGVEHYLTAVAAVLVLALEMEPKVHAERRWEPAEVE